ncbi:MAG: L-seryl-tRNA(Sec) selenium transferase [Deltaproteobacteria bacterium]|nr:L-seryl-tRNA(Sec) selenium transferase [Deltaproteobacteria bacterium]
MLFALQPLMRQLPSIDKVLQSEGLKDAIKVYSRQFVADVVREVLEGLRKEIKVRSQESGVRSQKIETLVRQRIEQKLKPSLKKVINLSGTILHTNLGRAILCDEAVEAIRTAAANPVNLEFDVELGERGDRDSHIESLICYLTGAEAATVVNNNVAAVFLTLNTLAEGRDVVISRGELVEIGGSFRIPDVIKKSGCNLVEVGTTNRTHHEDYTNAINPNTAFLLKAHTSNYRIIGFASSVPLKELVSIGRKHSLPVIEDLGSGSLVDISMFGLPKEPVVRESIEAGADVVTFSGDKLLGGPQAGIIVGKRDFIKRLRNNPLKRALRLDKLTIAGLETTLKLYLNIETLPQKLPILRFLTRPVSDIEKTAKDAANLLKNHMNGFEINIEDSCSQIGSGSLPEETIPTKVISITHKNISPEKIFDMFLKSTHPILGRVYKGKFLLDMRMIEDTGDLEIQKLNLNPA